MSIAKLLKTHIILAKENDAALISELETSRQIHIEDVHDEMRDEIASVEESVELDFRDVDATIQKARWILDIYKRFSSEDKGLLHGFFGSAPYVEEQEFADILRTEDIDHYEANLRQKHIEYEDSLAQIEKNRDLVATLTPWRSFDVELSDVESSDYTVFIPVVASDIQLAKVRAAIETADAENDISWSELQQDKNKRYGIFVVLKERAGEFEGWLKNIGTEIVAFPDDARTAREIVRAAREDIRKLEGDVRELEHYFVAEADNKRQIVQAYFDEYTNRRKNLVLKRKILYTRNIVVITGWIRQEDCDQFTNRLVERFPEVELRFAVPKKDETPPVILDNHPFIRPFQILIEMFGLPKYFGIDPTPFVAVAMTLFYAMCLGDAGYGCLQILIALWLKRKFKPDEGTRLFLDLFLEMGIATTLFGIITWSFFGASPGFEYGVKKVLGFLPLFSPTNDIMVVIGISLGIGAVSQLGSILAGFINSLKIGDIEAAILDYITWFVLLISLLLGIGSLMLQGVPRVVGLIAYVLIAVSALCIVIFSGRENKGVVSRLITGIVSLYGIVGYYGIVSFFADVLSYMRLAILNLTSGFIGMVANLVGDLIVGGGGVIFFIVSLLLGVFVVVAFHMLNLLLSMLGSFVHSLRLNYLESFNRYFPVGGKAFVPFKREAQYYRFEK